MTVERDYRDEKAVLSVRDQGPRAAIGERDRRRSPRRDDHCRSRKCKDFRRSLAISGLPRPLRRFLWWVGLNVGRQRANYFGTFGVSVYSALGASRSTRSRRSRPH